MTELRKCSRCGAELPANAPGGHCLACLLQLGMASSIAGDQPGPNHNLPVEETPGTLIGRYKLLEKLGEGGFGAVYVAEQREPVKRLVALKIIKPGMDTKQVVARFEAERQALALMEHPNIARVFDAGATETGRPFFVMELVRGIRVTDYCDQQHLSTRGRLELFVQICHAVQHAHQKGIIHRDLKPSNILVVPEEGAPLPKVIDFGIAKATHGSLTDLTLVTGLEQLIGTPAYMSPEQAGMGGLDLDTRTDIYSLGVLLYELLTGKTPFDTQELLAAGLDEMRLTIRDKEPPRPSTRLKTMPPVELTTAARHRQVEPPKLLRLVRGDLDWIVMKCLEKGRNRRYTTANELALDIQRHLTYEPVEARRPSSLYRCQKLVRRNPLAAATLAAVVLVVVLGALVTVIPGPLPVIGAVVALLLVLATIVSTSQAIRAARARQAAVEAHANEARLRRQAETQERLVRRDLYVSETTGAFDAWEAGRVAQARDLLERQRPRPGEEDLRGFEWRYLYGMSRPQEVVTLRGELPEVWGGVWSPDGKYVAFSCSINALMRAGSQNRPAEGKPVASGSGSLREGQVELWDWASRRRIEVIPGAVPPVYHVAFSPDGRILAFPIRTADRAGVALWDLKTHRVAAEFTVESGGSPGMVFSHDGRWLIYSLSGAYNVTWRGKILVCDLTGGSEPCELTGHDSTPMSPDISPDDRWLVTPHGDGNVILWDLHARQIAARLIGHRGMVYYARFSPDGKTLATGGIDGTVRLWDVGERRSLGILGTHRGAVFGLGFSPDGRLLVSGCLDHTAKVWDLAGWRETGTLKGHRQRITPASFSPDGQFILTGSTDGTLKIWRRPATTGDEPFARHGGFFAKCAFSPDGRWLLMDDVHQRQTTLWEMAARRKIATLDLTKTAAGFSHDSRMLAGFDLEGRLAIWDLSGPEPRLYRTLTDTPPADLLPVFTHDGRALVFCSGTDSVLIWDWWQGRQVAALREGPPAKTVHFHTISPDGGTLVTGYADGKMRFWNTSGWKQDELVTADAFRVYAYAFSPDSSWLATGGQDTRVHLWNVARRSAEELATGAGPVDSVAFAPDGRTLAVGTYDGLVVFWNLPSRRELTELKVHSSVVDGLAFSPDGHTLATVCVDGTMRLWDAPRFVETDASSERAQAPNP